jgi:hypothetical protein
VSITDPNRSTTNRATDFEPQHDRARAPEVVRPEVRETKPSPKTTELWLTIIGVAVLTVVYNAAADTSLNLFRACLLGTIMAAAYVVSRGFAKAGSDDKVDHYGSRS